MLQRERQYFMRKTIKNFNLSKAIIPNSFTALNIFSGFVSIVFASRGEYTLAVYLIFAAAVFDMIDGLIARLVNTTSPFGVELDSLSDIVSFGAAPSFLIYQVYFFQFDYLGIIISALPMIFGAFRLARFNILLEDYDIKPDFNGLPIPASALTISSFVLFYLHNLQHEFSYTLPLTGLMIILSFLMVSNIKYDSFPKLNSKAIKEKPFMVIFMAISLIVVIIAHQLGLFIVFISLVLFGILRSMVNTFINKNNPEETELNSKEA